MLRIAKTPLTLLLVLGLAACSGGGKAKEGSGSTVAANKAANLKTVKDGTLTFGTNLPFAPLGFYEKDGKTMTGAEIDMMNEVAKKMHLKPEIQNTAWDGLIPGAKANRYDVVWASIGDYTDRQKQVDFVDYLQVRMAVVVRAADAGKVKGQDDLCGMTVGATKGASTVTIAEQFSKECTAKGKQPLQISQFPSTAEGLTALRSQRTDAEVMDGPVAVYKSTIDRNVFALALDAVGPETLYGAGVNKANPAMRDALKDALNEIIADGSYRKILEKYGLTKYAIKQASVNAGGAKT